ncbi:unnamed protein product, partial [Closterium sp. NIES-54]
MCHALCYDRIEACHLASPFPYLRSRSWGVLDTHPASSSASDTCALKTCGVNSRCTKDIAGVASCVCDTGFALQADGVTCT